MAVALRSLAATLDRPPIHLVALICLAGMKGLKAAAGRLVEAVHVVAMTTPPDTSCCDAIVFLLFACSNVLGVVAKVVAFQSSSPSPSIPEESCAAC
jgi:hypothetical protein